MKKAILLLIGCLAYISVQAQSPITIQQIEKNVEAKIQMMAKEVSFSDTQKTYLNELLVYTEKNKAGTFTEELKANPIRDVNMNTFFSKEQRMVIQKYQIVSQQGVTTRVATGVSVTQDGKSKF